ncbi:hypothetical protein ACSVDM_30835, partial [Nocardia sp. JW2]|uniref:hypothetical protein n=1 Tax=Nocardia sp. JW2 TaxID=3450738 RepID=UPI003F43BE29
TVQFSNNTPEVTSYPDQLGVTAGGIKEDLSRSFVLALKKHSRVLSGPNSVSVYHHGERLCFHLVR